MCRPHHGADGEGNFMFATTTTRPATGRGRHVRRIATVGLTDAADLLDNLAFLVMIGLAVTSIGNVGPAWAQLDDGSFAVAVFALYGAARVIEGLFNSLADAVNPDSGDGDPAYLVAIALRGLASDVDNGADADDVLMALQDSRVLAEMGDVLSTLAVHSLDDGELEEANAQYAAAGHLYRAARELGDKQL